MSNTPNANDMMPSDTPSNTTTTYRRPVIVPIPDFLSVAAAVLNRTND
jgi:hypothetical protein